MALAPSLGVAAQAHLTSASSVCQPAHSGPSRPTQSSCQFLSPTSPRTPPSASLSPLTSSLTPRFQASSFRSSPSSSRPSSLSQPRRQRTPWAPPRAATIQTDGKPIERWWEKDVPSNMTDLRSTQEFVEALAHAGEKLVVVEFYGSWCGSCRALFPKLCKLAREYPEVLFYKIDFDANKALCKSLNIRVLPFFHFYRGAEGRLDTFSASISKLQRLKDALATHSTDRCSLGPPAGPEQVLHPDLVSQPGAAPATR